MTKYQFATSVLLLTVAVVSAAKWEGRIVGGEVVSIDDYPYQVSMNVDGKHNCGGTIISNRFVITASHCTQTHSPDKLTIRAGSSFHATGGQLLGVKTIIEHPQWNPMTVANDIAILELADDIIFGGNVQPMELQSANEEVPAGTNAVCSGWGLLKEGGEGIPDELHAVEIPIVDHQVCKNAYMSDYTDIINGMICAGYIGVGGKDACSMDSGGPLVANGKLVGVVSFGLGCGRATHPGVYADVSYYRSFIKEHTGL